MTRALACFSDNVGLWWLRLLKPGFRHCFVVVETAAGWVTVESLSHCVTVGAMPPLGSDPASWLRAHGLVVVEARVSAAPPQALPWRPFTCVEMVKRVLGLRAAWVATPWQLWRHLEQNRNKALDERPKQEYNHLHQHQNCVRFQPLLHEKAVFLHMRREQKRIKSHKEIAMGGFSSPSPPAPPAPPQSTANPDDEARKQRIDAMERNRRGRQGLISTSDRGLLAPAGGAGKTLLGE